MFHINTNTEIKSVNDLSKLREIMEANNLGEPNFSELGRKLGVDRRTAKKYYFQEGDENKRKQKKSVIDDYYKIIKDLLSTESLQQFSYKSHLYRYLRREKSLNCSRSNFNHYILKHEEFANYFKPKERNDAIKTETPFGKQAQFDWKEKLKFVFSTGEYMTINVGSLVLSASRFKVWAIYPTMDQNALFDFIATALEMLGGVPEEIVVDNAKTIMDHARTEKSKGKVNARFQQLAEDFGFKIVSCIRRRPQTKAKVESPMKIIDEIMNYNGVVEDLCELSEKLNQITNEANARVCQSTNLPPILVYSKEKEHLLPLPNSKICSYYKNETVKLTINPNALFTYKQCKYSVPAEYIGKSVFVHAIENNLHVYYNKKLIVVHEISRKNIKYTENHHFELFAKTFPGKDTDELKEMAGNHLKPRFSELITIFGRMKHQKQCNYKAFRRFF